MKPVPTLQVIPDRLMVAPNRPGKLDDSKVPVLRRLAGSNKNGLDETKEKLGKHTFSELWPPFRSGFLAWLWLWLWLSRLFAVDTGRDFDLAGWCRAFLKGTWTSTSLPAEALFILFAMSDHWFSLQGIWRSKWKGMRDMLRLWLVVTFRHGLRLLLHLWGFANHVNSYKFM